MSSEDCWKESEKDIGFFEYELDSWECFGEFINKIMLQYTNYIYRGHGDERWKLEPTVDRIVGDSSSYIREEHLTRFKYETRSRRGNNPPELKDDNDWWALGQHHGLLTPLLDWTQSPFVALFFAVSTALKEKTKKCSVYALWQGGVNIINENIKESDKIENINNRKPTVKIFRPLSDENNRLVNQRGLFTRGPNNMTLEEWVPKFSQNIERINNLMILIKITIPSNDLENCLRYLNRMNINDSTLFPDLTGASIHCNNYLSINNY
ncbi:FRG domain-containing protein [Sulfuricurvum sp.]|uniref:FRG domain-containing protein n=1 Tax=Sulfuricurvum sp. TaxID=2025608 RepID=UPI003C658226